WRRLAARLAVLAVAFLSACGGIDRGSYVSSNERLVDSLPVYPGAQKADEDQSVGYPAAGQLFPENDSSGGYTTYRRYGMPAGKRCGQVQQWYGLRLGERGWKLDGGGDDSSGWEKGSAVVSISCGPVDITVTADHHALP